MASVLFLSLKAVSEAVWAFGSLTPLENCVQIKIPLHSQMPKGLWCIYNMVRRETWITVENYLKGEIVLDLRVHITATARKS